MSNTPEGEQDPSTMTTDELIRVIEWEYLLKEYDL